MGGYIKDGRHLLSTDEFGKPTKPPTRRSVLWSSSSTVRSYQLRLIRYWTVPITWLPHRTPFIGGKTAVELLVMLFMLVSGINYALNFVVPISAGRFAADIAAVTIACGFRNNILSASLGISYERGLYWHKFGSFLWVMIGIIHGVRETPQVVQIFRAKNLLGLIILLVTALSALLYYCHRGFNLFKFEWFYASHIGLFMVVAVVAWLHGAGAIGFACLAWFVDLTFRYIVTLHKISAKVSLLPGGVVKICFPKIFEYSPGQYCFIMVPAVSKYQFHPFSCSSAPHEEFVEFHICIRGDWTMTLREHVARMCCKEGQQASEAVDMDVCVEGPFGRLTVDPDDASYKVIVLVAGGIGITPIKSILNHLVNQHGAGRRSLTKCVLVWCAKDKIIIDSFAAGNSMDGGAYGKLYPLLLNVMNCPSNGFSGIADDAACTGHRPHIDIRAGAGVLGSAVFHKEMYLTAARADVVFDTVLDEPSVKFGRPELKDLIYKVAAYCTADTSDRGSTVAVFACGPQDMVAQLADLCAYRHSGITFHMHQEKFHF
jgi:predicted ferric reductase